MQVQHQGMIVFSYRRDSFQLMGTGYQSPHGTTPLPLLVSGAIVARVVMSQPAPVLPAEVARNPLKYRWCADCQ
jgi:hypothetical protein